MISMYIRFPTGDIPEGPPALIIPTVRRWRREDWPVRYLLENPKKAGSQSYLRYEAYKGCSASGAFTEER